MSKELFSFIKGWMQLRQVAPLWVRELKHEDLTRIQTRPGVATFVGMRIETNVFGGALFVFAIVFSCVCYLAKVMHSQEKILLLGKYECLLWLSHYVVSFLCLYKCDRL